MKGAIIGFALIPILITGCLAGALILGSTSCPPGNTSQAPPSEYAQDSIPANYLEAYQDAGADRGVPWNVLAAIGQVESHHGRWDGPGITEGHNSAGAAGPMQFGALEGSAAGNTWGGEPVMAVEDRPDDGFGVDGNNDGTVDVYDPGDAIPAAADYLLHHGAPEDIENALFAYNRAWWYVEDVLEWAERYAEGDYDVSDATGGHDCADATIGQAPDELTQAVVDWALAQRGKPYVWGGTGPDSFDCSGLTLKAYESVGVTIPRVARDQWAHGPEVPAGQEQPGDLVFFDTDHQDGSGGPGHVGMVVGDGVMVEAWCTNCGPIDTRGWDEPGRADILGFTRPLEHEQAKAALDL